jgi:hypothetical protein
VPNRDGQAGFAEMLQPDFQVPLVPYPGLDFLAIAVQLPGVPWPVSSAAWSSMLAAVCGESPDTASDQDAGELE